MNLKKILRKKRKIKQGEQDENEIAQTAASSLLALINVLDENNKFNRLDEMQNHMSKKITKQRGDLQAANKEESVKINRDKKKVSRFERYNFIFKLIKRRNKDNTKRSKETKKIQ
jgi:hypothetical protein